MRCLTISSTAAVLALAGCASVPPPTQEFTETQAAIRAADELGAAKTPDGALHLDFAQKQVTQAESLIDEDENEAAKWVLQRARLDAELAIAHAKLEDDRAAAAEIMEDINELEARAN